MMKTILYAWELGAGLGHLLRIKPILDRLIEQGHHVFAMVPDLAKATQVFHSTQIQLLQAPVHPTSLATPIHPMRSFPQILFNHGFGNFLELQAKTDAVRYLVDAVTPDLVICDHAPLTLLALRTKSIRKITIGCGFCVPADHFPMRDLRSWMIPDNDQLLQCEQQVLRHINEYLESESMQPIQRVGQLYGEVDLALLATIPELDPYTYWRNTEIYLPPSYEKNGTDPVWPNRSDTLKKCFVYLKLHKNLPMILKTLGLLPVDILAFIPNCPREIVDKYSSEKFQISTTPLRIDEVTRHADIAVLNGGINLTTSFLLRGIPVITLPLHLEQTLTAREIQKQQLGKEVDLENPQMIGIATHEVLETPIYRDNTLKLAEKYRDLSSKNMTETVVSHIGHLLQQ